jgi:hypothetical protein
MPSRTVYPPLDTLKAVVSDLWIVDSGPIRAMGLPIPVRMTVVRLQSGEVWMHSPTRYTKELHVAIERIGRIGHLVAPNIAHWCYLKEWQERCPNAVTWAAPGLERRSSVRNAGVVINGTLAEEPPSSWSADLDQLVIRGGFNVSEVAFLHKESRTLILTDFVENFEPQKMAAAMRPLARFVGVLAPHGQAPIYYRFVLKRNGPQVLAAARQLLAWSQERVIFCHGRWFERDGTAQLRRSLRWLLD